MTDHLGPYELRGELGRGAMAIVWRAFDTRLEREVAIKEPVIPAGTDATTASELGARFVREGKAAAGLNHPGIVTIYAADIYEGRPAIVMELIDGGTLADVLCRGPLAPGAALAITDQLLDAAGYAHAHGVVHRDIKPDNVFVTADGRVKLADFGIAHVGTTATLTQAGTVMGTPGYMAPEQVTGSPIDARADLFAIGVIAYELLTGRNPFGATDGVASTTVMYRIVHEPLPTLPPAALGSLPAHFDAVLETATAKDPAARFTNASAFRQALAGAPIVTARNAAGTALAQPPAPLARIPAAVEDPVARSRGSWTPYLIVGAAMVVVMGLLLVFANGSGRAGAGSPVTAGAGVPTADGGAGSGTPPAPRPPSQPKVDPTQAKAEIAAMIETWRRSRETLDFGTYISFYATSFHSSDGGGQDYSVWRDKKAATYGKTARPTIALDNIVIDVGSTLDTANVTLDQHYRSNGVNDDGKKTMRLERVASGWLIVQEDFTAY